MTLRSIELALLLTLGMFGVSIWLVVRSVRRRLRRVRARFGVLPAVNFSWLQGYGDRHRMWRAVSAAERAVSAAVAADAASGDLPSLVRRLRRTAQSVDRLLAAAGSGASRPGAGPAARRGGWGWRPRRRKGAETGSAAGGDDPHGGDRVAADSHHTRH